MSQAQLAILIDNVEVSYYETGAYYETELESFQADEFDRLEAEHNLSLI